MVFVGSCAGIFYAFNKATGEVRWSYDIRKDGKQQSFHGNPLVTDDLILIGTDYSCAPDGVGHVYAFERNTGKVRWKYQTTSVPTDILRIGPNVYFGSFQDNWYALTLRTGELVWKFSTGASNEGCDAIKSPVADERHLYLSGLDGFIYSLDATSGRVAWRRKPPTPPSTALALKDKVLFVGASDNHIYRLNPETGTTVAELPVEATPVGRLTFTADALILFLENRSERSGYVVSLNPNLTRLRWQQKFSPEWASERPNVLGELIIAGNCRGEAVALRASDGELQWKLNLKGCIRSIGSSENKVFVGMQEGTIYAYEFSPRHDNESVRKEKLRMIRIVMVLAFAIGVTALAVGQSMSPASDHGIFQIPDIKWMDGPASLPKGAKVALLEGNPTQEGPFTMRLHLPDGFSIQPHWHPAVEHVTVISGTFNLGMGEKFDTSAGRALPAGAFAFMPPGMRHFAWAKGETVVQIHGIGPWKINYVNPADDPRNKK